MKSVKTMPVKPKQTEGKMSDNNVLVMLHGDHQKVRNLFFNFSQAESAREKEDLVKTILQELYIHATVEEEIVYPEARKKADDIEDLMDEADTEHHVVKMLMAELSGMKASDDYFDAKVTVLCELVNHHVREEEKEMFEKIKESGVDLDLLGKKVAARKSELLSESTKPLKLTVKTRNKKIAS